ncbi:hypothetical protein PTT_18309 [Pyrenophora teres f. teres 0-1]|uniref:Uncharacterized protein n=1 Tax=Pyrenophora teres f. teres (strain 0-1) TaxID=861557 RepID=E3S6F4_PYRTT|nr:hypothetical protein PTT_18309 [Pyrenophora teres f. teres 0-1]
MTATCGDNDSDDVNPALHHDRLLDHDNGLAGCAPSWLSFSAFFGKEVHHTLDIFPSASKAFGRTAGMASIVSSCALRLLPRLYAWYLHHDGFADFARSWSSFSALFGKAVHQKLNISPAASNAFGYAAGVASIVSSSILRLLLGQDARPLHHDDLTDFAYSWLLFFALLGKVVRRTLNILPGALNAHECAYDMASIASFCVYQMLPCLDIWYLCHEGFTGLADNARSSSSCFTLLGKLFHHTLIFFFETLNMHELAKGIASVISSCGFQLASFVFHRRTLTVHLVIRCYILYLSFSVFSSTKPQASSFACSARLSPIRFLGYACTSANSKTGVAIVYTSSILSTNDQSINKVTTNNPPPHPAPKPYSTGSHQSNIKKPNDPPPRPQPKPYPTGPHQCSTKKPNNPPPRPQPKPYPTGPHQSSVKKPNAPPQRPAPKPYPTGPHQT